MKKLLRHKKGEEGSSQLPVQTLVELVITLTVVGIAFAIGSYILGDTRIYQAFLAKDISLVRTGVALSNADVDITYAPALHRLDAFEYSFEPYYTTVIDTQRGDNHIMRSYITMKRGRDSGRSSLRHPQAIHIFSRGDRYRIESPISPSELCEVPFKYIHNENIDLTVYPDLQTEYRSFISLDPFSELNRRISPVDCPSCPIALELRVHSSDVPIVVTSRNDAFGCTLAKELSASLIYSDHLPSRDYIARVYISERQLQSFLMTLQRVVT
ncbi:MAG: hypothetical protein ACMXYE_03660 [Candidatus Woesearchaeota archaeon]